MTLKEVTELLTAQDKGLDLEFWTDEYNRWQKMESNVLDFLKVNYGRAGDDDSTLQIRIQKSKYTHHQLMNNWLWDLKIETYVKVKTYKPGMSLPYNISGENFSFRDMQDNYEIHDELKR